MADTVKLFNDEALRFLTCDVFNSRQFAEWSDRYVAYWGDSKANLDSYISCSVCEYAMLTPSMPVVESMRAINQVCMRMAITPLGIIITWYAVVKRLDVTCQYAVQFFDPMSIFFHTIIGCCGALMNGQLNLKRAFQLASSLRRDKDQISADDARVADLASFLSAYSRSEAGKCRGKQMTDLLKPTEPCMFANTGDLSIALRHKNMPIDTRQLVSRKWFSENVGQFMPHETYMSSDLYAVGQIGITAVDINGDFSRMVTQIVATQNRVAANLGRSDVVAALKDRLKHEMSVCDTMMPDTTPKIKSLFSVMSGARLEKDGSCIRRMVTTSGDRDDVTDTSQKNLYEKIKDMAVFIVDRHVRCVSAAKSSPLDRSNHMLDNCVWCDLINIFEIRAALNDLTVMARNKIRAVGREFGGSGTKIASRFAYLRKQKNSKRKKTAQNYGYDGHPLPGARSAYKKQFRGFVSGTVVRGGLKRLSNADILELIAHGMNIYSEQKSKEIAALMRREQDRVYTNGFDDIFPTWEGVKTSFTEWAYQKFTFMGDIVDYVDKTVQNQKKDTGDIIVSLWRHLSSRSHLMCAINLRTVSVESDLFQNVFCGCLFPFVYACAQLCAKLKKLDKAVSAFLDRQAAAHNLSVYIENWQKAVIDDTTDRRSGDDCDNGGNNGSNNITDASDGYSDF